jgi:hypothetical protein
LLADNQHQFVNRVDFLPQVTLKSHVSLRLDEVAGPTAHFAGPKLVRNIQ